MRRPLILITRPYEEALPFAKDITRQGFMSLIAPMLEIVPVDFTPPDISQFAAVIFTSKSGVRAFCEKVQTRNVSVFCVGHKSAEDARAAGFSRVISAGGTVQDLADLLAYETAVKGKHVLHVRGHDTAYPLQQLIAPEVVTIDELVVYQAQTVSAFTSETRAALASGKVSAATFFSKRTAAHFMNLIQQERLRDRLLSIKALSISEGVLECVQPELWAETYTATKPDAASMIALMKSVCV